MYQLDFLKMLWVMLYSWTTPLCFAVVMDERGAIGGSAIERTLEEEDEDEEEKKPTTIKETAFTWEDARAYALTDEVRSGEVLLAYVNIGKAEMEIGLSERGRFGLMVQRAYLNSVGNYIADAAGMQFVPQPGFEVLAEEIGFSYLTVAKARPTKKQFIFSWLTHLVLEAKTITKAQVNYTDDLLLNHVVKTLEAAGMTYARRHVPPYAWPTVKQGPRADVGTAKAYVVIDGKETQWPGDQADLTAKQPWWEELFEAFGVNGLYGFVEYVVLVHGTEEVVDNLMDCIGKAVTVAHELDDTRFRQRAAALKASRAIQEKRKQAGG